jgi:hypothetical protein
MDILADRIGILLKYGKMIGGITKRYFFIDNNGIMYYTDREAPILELLNHTTYDNENFVKIMTPLSKTIPLQDCSISGIKNFLENKFDLQGRSYFELFIKRRDFRSTLVFSYKEQYIKSLHNYIRELTENNKIENFVEKELHNFDGELKTNSEYVNLDSTFNKTFSKSKNIKLNENIFSNAKSDSYLENVITKLSGKYVNQTDWKKDCIKVIDPSSNLEEHEEAWVMLENGSNYSGPVKNGMPHGIGKEYRPDGSLYTGNFFKGKWHGVGTITNETLDTYQGEFIDGCICGI